MLLRRKEPTIRNPQQPLKKDVFLLALVGHPVAHSLSPAMHRAALEYAQLNGDYVLMDVPPEKLSMQLQVLKSDYCGFNVTIPHKQAVFQLSDQLSEDARLAQAVNTVKISDHQLIGHNTDIGGFRKALAEIVDVGGALHSALLIGAGGAARAAFQALSDLPRVDLLVRNKAQGLELVKQMQSHSDEPPANAVYSTDDLLNRHLKQKYDLIVNCAPLGQRAPDLPSWCSELLPLLYREGLFFDMVYARNDEQTPMVSLFRANERQAVDGLTMLVHQAALSFAFWTDIDVPPDVMRRAVTTDRKQ